MRNVEQIQSGLAPIDRHIANLEEKIQRIKVRIAMMQEQGRTTQPQDEFLATTLKILKDMQTMRSKALASLGKEGKQPQGSLRTS